MDDFQQGDLVSIVYDDTPELVMKSVVKRYCSDQQEGLGVEVDFYVNGWLEVIPVVEDGVDAKAQSTVLILLGNDLQPYIDGRKVTINKA